MPDNQPVTTTYDYRILHNVTARFMRGFVPDDLLIRGWESTIVIEGDPVPFTRVDDPEFVERMRLVCDHVFGRHNHDGRPDGQLAPSISVGDVIRVKQTGLAWAEGGYFTDWTVEPVGFSHVHVDEAHQVLTNVSVTNGTWERVWRRECARQEAKK